LAVTRINTFSQPELFWGKKRLREAQGPRGQEGGRLVRKSTQHKEIIKGSGCSEEEPAVVCFPRPNHDRERLMIIATTRTEYLELDFLIGLKIIHYPSAEVRLSIGML